MGKQKTPTWQLMGLDGPPPPVNGMCEYGTVWTAEDPRPTRWENLRSELYWGAWSLDYWGKKVRRDIEHLREHDPRATMRARALDRMALGMVSGAALLYRVAQKGEPSTLR